MNHSKIILTTFGTTMEWLDSISFTITIPTPKLVAIVAECPSWQSASKGEIQESWFILVNVCSRPGDSWPGSSEPYPKPQNMEPSGSPIPSSQTWPGSMLRPADPTAYTSWTPPSLSSPWNVTPRCWGVGAALILTSTSALMTVNSNDATLTYSTGKPSI